MSKKEGIDAFLNHGRIGFNTSLITQDEHQKLEILLQNPKNGIIGYSKLLDWVQRKLNKDIKNTTLLKYVQRNFNAKIKVAHKSHINKDKEAVEFILND